MSNLPLLYSGIIGSYCQNLQTPNSDVDIIEVYSSDIVAWGKAAYSVYSKDRNPSPTKKNQLEIKYNIPQWKQHLKIFSAQAFCFDLFFHPSRFGYEHLFPYQVLSENELTNYLQKYNEDIVSSILPNVYQKLMFDSEDFYNIALKNQSNVDLSKAIIRKTIAIDYVTKHNFKDSLINNSFQPEILGVKTGAISYTEGLQIFDEVTKKALELKSYYQNQKVDQTIVNQTVVKILQSQDFSPHYLD